MGRSHRRLLSLLAVLAALALVLAACGGAGPTATSEPPAATPTATLPPVPGIQRINHLIVIYQENWSFDGLYGKFPGANGIADAGDAIKQVDKEGKPYIALPQPLDTAKRPAVPDPRFPATLPVAPFDLSQYVTADQKTGDMVHRFYQEQYQIDGGKMNKFAAWSDNPGLVMSYYDATNFPVGKLAQEYTLADNFFHAAFGGSFLNRVWLICACTPVWPNAPSELVAEVDANGVMVKDGRVTPDGYAINNVSASNPPHLGTASDPARRLPLQTMTTIGERLTEKGISWAWFSGGWNDALAGNSNPGFPFGQPPFNYFANYAVGKPARDEHLKDVSEFLEALQSGMLPAVSFIKPLGRFDEHPGYADVLTGQQYAADLVEAVQHSPYWKDSAIIITYDENGGRWDHVAPSKVDRWGPGTRVPTIIISPYAKRHFVDHTQYDTTAILKFIETRWGLAPLGTRDAAANNLLNAFDFTQRP